MWTTYWWEIVGEESDLCGEEFFTALEDCLGMVTEEEAEMMGLDTY